MLGKLCFPKPLHSSPVKDETSNEENIEVVELPSAITLIAGETKDEEARFKFLGKVYNETVRLKIKSTEGCYKPFFYDLDINYSPKKPIITISSTQVQLDDNCNIVKNGEVTVNVNGNDRNLVSVSIVVNGETFGEYSSDLGKTYEKKFTVDKASIVKVNAVNSDGLRNVNNHPVGTNKPDCVKEQIELHAPDPTFVQTSRKILITPIRDGISNGVNGQL